MTKRRRYFRLESESGKEVASGVLYDEGNVQITWRCDIGYTAEQYSDVELALDLLPGITVLRVEKYENTFESRGHE